MSRGGLGSLGNAKLLLIATACCLYLSQIILHNRSIIFGIATHALAIQDKEVAVQHGTDALQQYRVDSLTLEDIVNVGTVTVEALGQPRCAAPLAAQLILDFSPDVY